MNKQEAIELLHDVANRAFYRTERRSVHIDKIVEVVNQIDEPQKPVIPKFVAEWYEKNNDNLSTAICNANIEAYIKVNRENDDFLDTFERWLVYEYNSISILVQMKLFGYEIEQEKLYTVEIPNPHSYIDNHSRLARNYKGKVVLEVQDWVNTFESYKLTESEIKQDFDWAWQWAKPVEEN